MVGLNKTGTVNDLRPNLTYDIVAPNGDVIKPKPRRRRSKEKFEKSIKENRIVFKKTKNNWSVSYKQYLNEDTNGNFIERGSLFKTIIENCGTTTDGTNELSSIIGKGSFDFPKPIELIKSLLKISSNKKSIILDFFAGSGTTGQAVLELNMEDEGERQFILCNENDEKNKICEKITYERLKTFITGKRKDGSIYRENPYNDNLTYLKVNFAEKDDNIEPYKICEELIALKSSIETCPSFIFDKDEDFYEFLDSNIYSDDCVVYLLDDILLPSGNKLKERKMEIRELPKYFYSEEELINNDII